MKIHIVQKGDTLWEISQQYGVDFEELKQLNSQISSPDMIMPWDEDKNSRIHQSCEADTNAA
ncbi:SafA/ExsA family spore coat assembly protein [Virgibacillus salarius]|uniref:SafA/ExsA family spore coat assembly protein n=1 Tax=Virgibacillus salarius TaxID=447199 RepID=UPI00249054AD|nr:SafA/ExsA family spore coat assembly protein [Virgibacillus salarius]WBX79028.1 SafA/ExsA family spore coat assembly protein [Virgibacillus salarius]